jgi:amino acid adenylation domain-containing protein
MATQIEGYRLSPLQKHLWLLQQDGSAYLSQCVIRLDGELDEEKLKEAVQSVVERHQILRTTFQRVSGIKLPLQAIVERSSSAWNYVDVRKRSREERDAEIERFFDDARQQPVDYERGSLLHATLLALSADEHVMILSLPSLCADNRSLTNLVLEIAESYGAQRTAGDDDLVQYLQFSEWQNEVIEDENAEAGKEYWRQQDISKVGSLALPLENPGIESFAPRSVVTIIAPELRARIESVANDNEVTLATTLMACWQALLWRLTGQSDIVLGHVVEGRRYEDLESAIGLLARALPLNTHFSEQISLTEVVKAVKSKVSEAHDWIEYFTWDQSINTREMGDPGVIADTDDTADTVPFFPFAFEFTQLPAPQTTDDLTFSIIKQHSDFDRFKVKLTCFEYGDQLLLDWRYDSALFSEADMSRLAAQFHKFLTGVVENPQRSISETEVITDDERRHLVVELNQTQQTYSKKCVHQLLEEQVARTPNETALTADDQVLTFAELNARANQLAAYLRSLGVGPETMVAIYLERSPDLITAVLGTLKAGAAYVPIDLAYPKERLAFVLTDAKVLVLLTQERFVNQIPQHEAQEVTLDSDWPIIALESDADLVNTVDAANAAYVIYTSGSTGTPKGVVVTHQGLCNYLSWCTDAYNVAEGNGAPVHSPLGFDLTITSIFPPLLAGRGIVLVPEEQRFEGLSTVLRKHPDFSLVKITPSHLEVLNQMLAPEDLAGTTKTLIIGGEALNSDTLAVWRTTNVRLINEYGPTETVVGCCVYEVAAEDPDHGPVPIGRPIANTQLYILDKSLHPVPAGVTGELHIGGAGLARGYLERPELTANVFLPNPFSEVPGTRLYRTGDLARYRCDGIIEYLGRVDQQVKIRGFRIELGEIEAALLRHGDIAEAVVLARQDVPGDIRLVAYLVPEQDQAPAANDVRTFLRELLPEYMVPTAFVTLRAFPLTPNGKINREALPAPTSSSVNLEGTYVAPRTVLEEVIAAIWVEILGLKRVGVHDNFFEVGGHSLLAMQVISRIREEFQIELPVRSFFDGMTVERLAAGVLEREPEPGRSEKIAQTLKAVAEMSENELLAMISAKGKNENE